MVKKIVLVIDRDNDLGRKAGVSSPIIGRKANLEAAIKLAEVDPEDSDLNTIFGAIKIYDELRRKGENVEIVTICGDEKVGIISDEKIAEQLDKIARITNADSVIVVTDGSEDEFVLPIISSRFRIDGIKRIVVKQSKTIESTYYLIKKMLDDPKIAKTTLTPLGIILIVYSISLIFRNPELGIGAITFFLGFYFLAKAYGFEETMMRYLLMIKSSLVEGRLSFIMYLLSIIIFSMGICIGIFNVLTQPSLPGVASVATFIRTSIWWIVSSGILATLGKIFDLILEKKSFKKYISILFLMVASGFALWGASMFILALSGITHFSIQDLIISIVGSIIISLIGIIPFRSDFLHTLKGSPPIQERP